MQLRALVCALSVLVATPLMLEYPVQATEVGRSRTFGVGFAVGSPSSVVGKYYLQRGNALDFGVGFWRSQYRCRNNYCRGTSSVSLNADYLWQEEILTERAIKLDWHIGAGARFWTGRGDFAAAARMPVGLDLTFRRPNFIEVFLELAPAFYVVPGVGLDFEGFLGVRFYP